MSALLTIGKVSKGTGLPAKTIRFYEERGLIAATSRSEAGYRLYSGQDVRRLQLIRRLRLLGLGLDEVEALVGRALDADCATFGSALLSSIEKQRGAVERRIAELQELRHELEGLSRHVEHCCEGCSPDDMAAECAFCVLLIDEEGGEP